MIISSFGLLMRLLREIYQVPELPTNVQFVIFYRSFSHLQWRVSGNFE